MKVLRRVAKGLLLGVLLLVVFSLTVAAANPTVSISVSAQVVSITNSQSSWAIGTVVVDDVKYFSADNNQDDDYSMITNTGNVDVDVEIQGTDFEGGTYDWTLAAATGNQTYSLYANSSNGSATYNIEVKSSAYNDLVTSLSEDNTYDWSMNFTAPSAFHPNDNGATKNATVTLVASKS